ETGSRGSDMENRGPVVTVPESQALASEPAKTIGDVFASRQMIRTYVAAAVGIVAAIFHWAIDDALVDNIALLVELLALVAAGVMAQMDAAKRARQQAEATRDVVYAPETVA